MKKKALKWTEEELEILKNNYCELGLYKTTTLIPNHPMCSVVAKARKLGLSSEKRVQWTEEELEILRKYYPVEGTKVYKRLKIEAGKMLRVQHNIIISLLIKQ